VGCPVANRGRREIEGLIGFFLNTLVLRTDMSRDPGFREILARVRESALAAYDHQDLPFEKLVDEVAPTRDLNRSPLFSTWFTLQDAEAVAIEIPGATVRPVPMENGIARFDLSLLLWQTSSELGGVFEYSTDLFDPSSIAREAEHFENLLAAVAAAPDTKLSALKARIAAADRKTLARTGQEFEEADLRKLRSIKRSRDKSAATK
jgi:non-ribosomal peptide synthetase component F